MMIQNITLINHSVYHITLEKTFQLEDISPNSLYKLTQQMNNNQDITDKYILINTGNKYINGNCRNSCITELIKGILGKHSY